MNREVISIIDSCKDELNFKTARSSGSGGQHVNKVETKVSLLWDFNASPSLSDGQKSVISEKCSASINNKGILSIHCEEYRSQLKNKDRVVKKWEQLLANAFIKRRKRRATQPSKASVEKRLKIKSTNSTIKQNRKKPQIGD